MRTPVLAAVALLAAACTSPCQELGNRLCECPPIGTARDTCERQVDDQLNGLDPGQDQQDRCDAWLRSCHEPSGAAFCEWLETPDAKVACGLANPASPSP